MTGVLDLITSQLLRVKDVGACYRRSKINKTTKLRMWYGSFDANMTLSTKAINVLKCGCKNIPTMHSEFRKE